MKRIAAILVLIFAVVAAHATVTTGNLTVSFTCTGSTGPFPFTFPISDPTALTVTQNGTVLSSSAYTMTPVNNNYSNGGSVTLNSSCPNPQPLVLTRISPVTQTSVFADNMPIPMKTIENGLDKLTEIEQEQSSSLHGLWMLPIYSPTSPSGTCTDPDQVEYVTGNGSPYIQFTCVSGIPPALPQWVQTGGGPTSGGGGSPGSPNGSAQFNNASALGGEPAYLYASAFSGSDWVAKVNACGTALATNGGGACDATDLAGQTSTSTLTWGDGVHIMDLKLGQGTYTAKSYVYRTFSQWHAPGNAGSTAPPGTTLVCSQPTANVFTGSVSGSTLTVTAVSTGALALYQTVIGPGLDQYALIVALGTGTGGTGTYTLANAYTVSSTTLNTGNACMSGYPETGFGNQLHNPVMQGFQIESSGSAAQGNGSTGLLLGGYGQVDVLNGQFSDLFINGFDVGTALYDVGGCDCYNIFNNVNNTGSSTASIKTLNLSGYPFGINSNHWTGGKQWGPIGLWDTNGQGNTWDGVMDFEHNTSTTGAILYARPIPTTNGTGYAVGDTVRPTSGGTGGVLTVTSISGGGGTGPVTGLSVTTPGTGYSNGALTQNTEVATTAITGSGTGLVIEQIVQASRLLLNYDGGNMDDAYIEDSTGQQDFLCGTQYYILWAKPNYAPSRCAGFPVQSGSTAFGAGDSSFMFGSGATPSSIGINSGTLGPSVPGYVGYHKTAPFDPNLFVNTSNQVWTIPPYYPTSIFDEVNLFPNGPAWDGDAVQFTSIGPSPWVVGESTITSGQQAQGLQKLSQIPQPSAPNVVSTCTGSCSTSYTFYVVGFDSLGGETVPSAGTTISNGPATLSGSNYITVTPPWPTNVSVGPLQYGIVCWAVLVGTTSTAVKNNSVGTCPNYQFTGFSLVDNGQGTVSFTPLSRTNTGDSQIAGAVIPAQGVQIAAGTMILGATGKVIYGSDATNGYAEVNENNTGLSRVCTAANGICAGAGVSSINSTAGAFTFSGSGVSCTGTTCTFSGSGSGIGSITWSVPAYMSATPSTISASGTQTFGFNSQTANQVFAGPGSGSAALPGFRALVSADIPTAIPIGNIGSAGLSGTAPVSIASTGAISMHVADASDNGYLSSTDWSTFNGKQAALSLIKGTYVDGDLCAYTASGTLLNCNVTPGGTGTVTDGSGTTTTPEFAESTGTAHVIQYRTASQALGDMGAAPALPACSDESSTFTPANSTCYFVTASVSTATPAASAFVIFSVSTNGSGSFALTGTTITDAGNCSTHISGTTLTLPASDSVSVKSDGTNVWATCAK